MKKVLIIHASAGDGHKRAAEAVYNTFLESKNDDVKVTLIDSLDYTNPFFKDCYRIGYLVLVKYLPTLWGLVYYMLDNRFFFLLNKPFRRLINSLNTQNLEKFLIDEKFDIIIATHFLAVEVTSHLKSKGIISSLLMAVLTDFKPHYYWQSEKVDLYTVAVESTKTDLVNRGADERKIRVVGIPIRKGFGRGMSREEARSTIKIDPDSFTILVMGGGHGVGPIKETVSILQKLSFQCQIVAVCGHNNRLLKKLNSLRPYFSKPTYIYGFREDVDVIMAASDMMVTKVGGVTAAETLSSGLAILTIKPLPGQEMNNARFLFDNNVGFKLAGVKEVNYIASVFYETPQRLKQIRDDMRRLARPNAAGDIVRLTLGTIYG